MSDLLTGIDRRMFFKQAGSRALGLAAAGLASTGTTEKISSSDSVLPNITLPTGNWKIIANGETGILSITSTTNGNLSGTVLGQPITGFWNSTSGEITFVRNRGSAALNQTYTGYYFTSPGVNYLAGYFVTCAGIVVTVQRHFFGWFASIT